MPSKGALTKSTHVRSSTPAPGVSALAVWMCDGPPDPPPVAEALNVHQVAVRCLAWHPLGHVLVRAGGT